MIDFSTVEEGDELRVNYRSTGEDIGTELTQTTQAEVLEVEFTEVSGYLYATITLAHYRDEDDTIPRRRLEVQPENSPTLEVRHTTINGTRWQRLHRATDIDVERVE